MVSHLLRDRFCSVFSKSIIPQGPLPCKRGAGQTPLIFLLQEKIDLEVYKRRKACYNTFRSPALGYTEHSFAHVTHVAEMAGYILQALDHPERTVEVAKIAAIAVVYVLFILILTTNASRPPLSR